MPENQISKVECKKLQKIRTRASYLLFRELYDFLNKKPSVADILSKFHDILDGRRSFGSIRNAECAAESLSLVLKDNGEMNDGFIEQESQTKSKTKDIAREKLFGNFILGDFFGDIKCRHGHETRMFNIGRGHYFACDKCRTYIFVGSNLISTWRQENKDIWQANYDSVEGYKFIE
jgi:hypothetical protein